MPKIFNARVGGQEIWGAIVGAEIGEGAVETRTIQQTLQVIDLLTMLCKCIVRNKSISIYKGACKGVELATGKKFTRR